MEGGAAYSFYRSYFGWLKPNQWPDMGEGSAVHSGSGTQSPSLYLSSILGGGGL